MARRPVQPVVFQPDTYQHLRSGINQIVDAVRPTLGPRARTVAIDRIMGEGPPEILDDGGLIARRTLQLADRDEDMGAMLIRETLLSQYREHGDGTATTAVLFQSVYNGGLRYLASGGDAMALRRHLEAGLRTVLEELDQMTVSIGGKEQLGAIAGSICQDPPLARVLGEIFDIIGEYGRIQVHSGHARGLHREYVEGMYWDRGVISRKMITDHHNIRTDLEDTAVMISDLRVEDPRDLVPIVEKAFQVGASSLLLIVDRLSPAATSLLLQTVSDKEGFQAIAVKTPGSLPEEKAAALEDLAVLTGGILCTPSAGDTAGSVSREHLGRARRVWADRFHFGITGGRGDPRLLREHIRKLQRAFEGTDDADDRKKLRERIGKLMGGSAILRVGGASKVEVERRKDLAERTSEALRGAIREGVVPGAGVALLSCAQLVDEPQDQGSSLDERVARRILREALEAPLRTILSNAGYDASTMMAEISRAGPGHGFDVAARCIVDVSEAGIWDAASVQKGALTRAVKGAALALTVDVLVHRKGYEQAIDE